MVSTKNQLRKIREESFPQPAARFVADFAGLIKAVDRLMVDISSAIETEPASAVPHSNGQPPTLNGTISTLRDHAQSFVKSLQHFQLMIDRIPVPFMELDGKARIVRANEECAEMLNGFSTPLIGKSLFNFVPDSDTRRLHEYLGIARQTNKPCVVHTGIANRGKYYPVELRLRRQFVGADIGYLAVLDGAEEWRDLNTVTNQRGLRNGQSIDELLVKLSHVDDLKSIGDTVAECCGKALCSPAGMIFVRQGGDLELLSQWHAKIHEKPLLKELTKRGPIAHAFQTGETLFWHRGRAPHSRVGRYFSRLLRQSHGQNVTFLPLSTPDQRRVGVIAIVLPYGDECTSREHKWLSKLACIVSGIITRFLAYEEAVTARDRAEHTIKSKDEFLSILSHELKNPMMPILGWAVALSSGTLPTDKQNVALEGIIRNIRALNYLIEDLFDTMRISSGKFCLEFAETRIQDVAREALTAIQHNVESKKLRISTDISEAIPAFMADSRRLHQVLMNLLNNAVKFTHSGGSISLRIRRRDQSVECIVSDTGKGIERKFLPFVFEKFRQENHSSKIHAAGMGLGLAIVREIVELHGGSIEAFSEGADRGSTFIVRLPIRRKHRRNGVQHASSNGAGSTRMAGSVKTTQNIRSNSDIRGAN